MLKGDERNFNQTIQAQLPMVKYFQNDADLASMMMPVFLSCPTSNKIQTKSPSYSPAEFYQVVISSSLVLINTKASQVIIGDN